VREVDPLDFLEAIRECRFVRGLEMTVGLASCSFGDIFAVIREGTPCDKEGRR
jgi:hypothetical protein